MSDTKIAASFRVSLTASLSGGDQGTQHFTPQTDGSSSTTAGGSVVRPEQNGKFRREQYKS
jgi:hypothetical protein